MTKRIQAKYKISRRLGESLWGRDKDPFNTKNYAPGMHGAAGRRKAISDFGTQLIAKQKLKGYYGNISEKQFRRIYKEATRRRGDTGEHLIGLLEQRLDAIVYRLNFVPTVFAARQLVGHKHVTVNGKSVNIPSYRVKEGDVIEVTAKGKTIPMVIEAIDKQEREIPSYIEADPKGHKGKFIRIPTLSDVPYPVTMEPNLVVEFYSR
jgi:small subunit ribosomal protein S4